MARQNHYERRIKPHLDDIQHWISEGYSHKQIYEMLNVSEKTFYKYLKIKSEFSEAIERGNVFVQVPLEKALYKESIGYTYIEKYAEIIENETPLGKTRTKKTKQVTKYARSNASLLIFSLCNKDPNKWKRVDKEIIEAIEEGIENSEISYSNELFEKAFKQLHEKKREEKKKKNDKESKKENE